MSADEMQDSGFECQIKSRSSLHCEERRGRLDCALRPSENTVLILTRKREREGTTIHMVSELQVELRQGFPMNAALDARNWVVFAIYRQGSSRLQFESTSCRGEIRVAVEGGALAAHGHVHLTFFDPRQDMNHIGEAELDFDF